MHTVQKKTTTTNTFVLETWNQPLLLEVFLKKVIHPALMFLNLNQRKSYSTIDFLQMFVDRIVCNLFGNISFYIFTLIPNVEDCSEEIYLSPRLGLSISASNIQQFQAGNNNSTISFGSFLEKVIHHALIFQI